MFVPQAKKCSVQDAATNAASPVPPCATRRDGHTSCALRANFAREVKTGCVAAISIGIDVICTLCVCRNVWRLSIDERGTLSASNGPTSGKLRQTRKNPGGHVGTPTWTDKAGIWKRRGHVLKDTPTGRRVMRAPAYERRAPITRRSSGRRAA